MGQILEERRSKKRILQEPANRGRSRLYNSQDVILIAMTRFGKGLIFHAVPLLRKKGIALIVSPLDTLQQDQALDIAAFDNAKPITMNWTSTTLANCRDIVASKCTYIFISPEILVDNELLRKEMWKEDFRPYCQAAGGYQLPSIIRQTDTWHPLIWYVNCITRSWSASQGYPEHLSIDLICIGLCKAMKNPVDYIRGALEGEWPLPGMIVYADG